MKKQLSMYYFLCFFTFFMMLTVQGCMLGPDYERPCVPIPDSFPYSKKHKICLEEQIEWWKQFKDPVLDALILEALEHNKDIKIAAGVVEQACGILMTTRSALFPQLNYTLAASRSRVSETIAIVPPAINPYNNFQVLGGASWEIDLWGRIRRQTEGARANLCASIEARRGVILSLIAEVGTSYIQLRALDKQLMISKKTLKSYAESVRYFEVQYQHGQVAALTVEQARSQYQAAAAQIPQLDIQITRTENALSILLGRNPGHIPRGKPIEALKMPCIPKDLPSDLLEQRPDILQAEQQLVAKNASIGAAKALYFPTLSLTGTLGTASESLSNLWRAPSFTWNYGASLVGPLFTAGAIEGQVVQACGATKAALENYKLTIQKAFGDVNTALMSQGELEKQYRAEQQRALSLKKYRNFAWERYNAGYSPYLEVLFADTQLYPAELSAVQAKAATYINIINIYKALGGSWIVAAETMTCD